MTLRSGHEKDRPNDVAGAWPAGRGLSFEMNPLSLTKCSTRVFLFGDFATLLLDENINGKRLQSRRARAGKRTLKYAALTR